MWDLTKHVGLDGQKCILVTTVDYKSGRVHASSIQFKIDTSVARKSLILEWIN